MGERKEWDERVHAGRSFKQKGDPIQQHRPMPQVSKMTPKEPELQTNRINPPPPSRKMSAHITIWGGGDLFPKFHKQGNKETSGEQERAKNTSRF